MRLLFFGSGEFGLPTLGYLHERHEIVAVISQPDRPGGRSRKLTPTPVAMWATHQGLPVVKSEDVNAPQRVQGIANLRVDASVVIAFGQKLSPQLVSVMGTLAVNLHASLLPKYRGAAPIQWAMIHHERVTGVSVIGLAEEMDAGDVYAVTELSIDPKETAGELHDRLANLGIEVVVKVLNDLEAGALRPQPQNPKCATRAPKLTKAHGTVDFNQSAETVHARIHGLTPWPGCRVEWTCRATGRTTPLLLRRASAIPHPPDFIRRRLEIAQPSLSSPGTVLDAHHVLTSAGTVKLLEVQAPGTRSMKVDIFARGHHLGVGDMLRAIKS